jgi:hypothetical protein
MMAMPADRPFMSIIVGAPGCGKTTLAPYVALLIDLSRARDDDAGRTSALIDAFIDGYKDASPADASRMAWPTTRAWTRSAIAPRGSPKAAITIAITTTRAGSGGR